MIKLTKLWQLKANLSGSAKNENGNLSQSKGDSNQKYLSDTFPNQVDKKQSRYQCMS